MMNREKRPGTDNRRLQEKLLEPHNLYPLFALAMLVLVWFVTLHLIRLENAAAERMAAETVRELLESYEAQMVRNLGSIDQSLKTVKYAYEATPGPKVLEQLEQRGLLPPRLVFTISLSDPAGKLRLSTDADAAADIRTEPFFQYHQRNDLDSVQVRLVKHGTSETKIQFSRRVNAADGSFGGVVAMQVAPDYFTSVYEQARLGAAGALGLIGADGVFFALRSGDRVTVGQAAFAAKTGFDEFGDVDEHLPEVNFGDGVERYASARKLYGYPLAVVTGLSRAEQFEGHERQKRYYLLSAAAISLLLVVISLIASRLLWQLAQSRKRTRKNQETYYAASEASNDGFCVLRAVLREDQTTEDFVFDDINHRGAVLLGSSKSALVGKRFCEYLPHCRENGIYDALADTYRSGQVQEDEWEINDQSTGFLWLQRQVVPVEDGVVLVIRDITDFKRSQARISHMAHHDALTGLPNRTLLMERLQQAVAQAQRNSRCVTVGFVDLDHFKPINDTHGHHAGDVLLKVIADRMTGLLRQTDTVARLGGDEFVMILADHVADRAMIEPVLNRLCSAIAEPVNMNGLALAVTASIGLASFPADGQNADMLLRQADAAMYHAKSSGRGHLQYYEPGMSWHTRDVASNVAS